MHGKIQKRQADLKKT